jgi:hypothetical protein
VPFYTLNRIDIRGEVRQTPHSRLIVQKFFFFNPLYVAIEEKIFEQFDGWMKSLKIIFFIEEKKLLQMYTIVLCTWAHARASAWDHVDDGRYAGGQQRGAGGGTRVAARVAARVRRNPDPV